MRFLAGALTGAILSTSVLGYIAAKTTTSYRSTLFPGNRVVISNGKATPKLIPFKQSPKVSKPDQRMIAEVRS